jgi:hypothetical protein
VDGWRREINGAAQLMDGGGGGGDGHQRASPQWETATAVAQLRWVMATAAARNGRQDCGVITMRGIENAVDGGGGDGRRRRNGRQDGRASTAGQGDGVSPSSRS